MDHNKTPVTKKKCLSNAQFFTVCNELLNRREEVTSTCHTAIAVAEYLSERTKLNVTESAARTALKTTGIEIVTRKKAKTKKSTSHMRTIGNALLKLFIKLGETPPQNLIDTMETLKGKELGIVGEPDQPEEKLKFQSQQFAVPVKSVPQPHTINVVNGIGK